MQQWVTEGFEAFRQGKFGNGGQNLYVSKAGVLQRIHRTSLFSSGYMDLVFCNSQLHEELLPIAVYPDPVNHPEQKRELYIGGANDGVVADLSGEGREDMAWACTWDGMTLLNNSGIYYNSDNGPSDKYVNYLPVASAHYVAAGDFDGDGRIDLVYFSQGELKLLTQDQHGFGPDRIVHLPTDGTTGMVAYHFEGEKLATLFLQKEDGSVTMRKEYTAEAAELPVFGADPDFVKKEESWDSYTQAVTDSPAKFRVVKIDGAEYLTLFRKKCLLLYPISKKGGLGAEPVRIDCPNGSAAEAGDVFGRGCSDLLVSCRQNTGKKESSYLYLGDGKCGFSAERRLVIPTSRASDVAMGNFSGGKGLDLVISQAHTHASFDNDVLVFPTGRLSAPAIPAPVELLSHDSTRVLVVHDKAGRPYLVVGNHHSRSYIGNPDNDIYFGSATGYHVHDRLGLPGWGSVDCICADFNDDGKADIAFSNAAELAPWMDYGSYVYIQKDGAFSRQPLRLHTNRAHGVICGDFNHNGYLDLLFCGFDLGEVRLFWGGPDGFSNDRMTVIPMVDENGKVYKEPRFISTADLNGDGYLELIITAIDSELSFVLWGGPDGFDFKRRQEFKVHHGVNSKVADLDGDGYPELIFASHSPTAGTPNDSYLYIYWGGPDGYSENRKTMLPCNAANSLNIADLNGDGLLDIFVASYQNAMERDIPSLIYWNSPEGFKINNRTRLLTHAVSGSIAADFNDDGHVDLAIANHKVEGNHIAYSTVWYNDGKGFCERNTVNLPTSGPHGMGNVDPGNILDRSFDEFYESVPHAIPEGTGVTHIFWDADVPEKCDVMAQLRVADSLEELAKAKWMGPTNAKDRFRANDHIDRDFFTGKFVQYRLSLYAHNAVETPRIRKVTVEFDTLGEAPKLF